ncbi:hypothetical protein ACFV4P_28825 [Kitasatospora sp. NPDC059795]|uniref:hypothetical protein n=1 Tax=Kitasatospora sp. NPDC059795 TaxID=3346949 RepID=UPI00365EFBFD
MERVRWVVDPLVGVGPLRFGMTRDEVREAIGEPGPVGAVDEMRAPWWQFHDDTGVTVLYDLDFRLVGIAVDAVSGPRVRIGEVELVGLVPSQVGADVRRLAERTGVAVRTNPVGDPDVPAWGLSMGAAPSWEPGPYGHPRRGDAQLSEPLLVAPELADDPYAAEPVRHWRDLVDRPANPGAWPVAAELDRPRWNWTPGRSIGLLRYGMSPEQVTRALGGAEPTLRRGRPNLTQRSYRMWPHQSEPRPPAPWMLEEEHFADLGVTAEYRHRAPGQPVLGTVTIAARTGPQLHFAGIPLVGRPITEVEADLTGHADERDLGLLYDGPDEFGPQDAHLYVLPARAGDRTISGVRLFAPDWEHRR